MRAIFSILRVGRWLAALCFVGGLLAAGVARAQVPVQPVANLPANWQWQNPLPQGFQLEVVQALNDSVAWAAGAGGTLLKTHDRGLHWQLLPTGTTRHLLYLSFASEQVGWVGYDTPDPDPNQPYNYIGPIEVRRTLDGGATWTVQRVPSSPRKCHLTSIQALSNTEVFVLYSDYYTNRASLYHSVDAGQSWQLLTSALPLLYTTVLHFITPQRGWMAGGNLTSGGAVLRTQDGGKT